VIDRSASSECRHAPCFAYLFTFAVSVPENVVPGQLLTIVVPDGTGRVVQAPVPQGMWAGHVFFVPTPPPLLPLVVSGIPFEPKKESVSSSVMTTKEEPDDLLLSMETEEKMPLSQGQQQQQIPPTQKQASQQQQQKILVKVPPGKSAGDTIRLRLADHREVDVTIPEGNVSEFYTTIPKENHKQNWHGHAYTTMPMATPFFF